MTPLENWLAARVALLSEVSTVDIDTPVYSFGIDSRTLAAIVEEAEREFCVVADVDRISPAETIRALAAAITGC